MRRRWFDADPIGSAVRPSEDFGPLFAATLQVHEATERGIQAAHEHANDRWKQAAYAAIIAVARRQALFSADDIWAELQHAQPTTHEPSALGALFRIAANRGLIVKSGERVKTRLARRHRDVVEWRSLIVDMPQRAG